jgi:triacylglycerol lipase
MRILTNFSWKNWRGKSPVASVASLILVIFITGCTGSLPQAFRQSLTVVVPHKVNFVELEYYAKRSNAAYTPANNIRQKFPRTTRVTTVKSVDTLYFLETDRQKKTQTITIRGTDDKANIWQDIEIALVKNNYLGINLHRGFQNDTKALHADIKPYLKRDYSMRVTGHSLGGAIAAILAEYLVKDGYRVERVVTFGQPKVTDLEGKSITTNGTLNRLTRVAHDQDVVPMLPPSGFPFVHKSGYQHFAPEVILRDARKYVYLQSHAANRISVGEFRRNISHFSTKEHHMNTYLSNIQEKVRNGEKQVPYFSFASASRTGSM